MCFQKAAVPLDKRWCVATSVRPSWLTKAPSIPSCGIEVTGNFDVNTNTGNATIEPQGLIVTGDLTISSIGDGLASLLMGANNLDVDGNLKITKTGGDLDAVEGWPQLSSSGQSNMAGNVELKKVRFDADKVSFEGTDNESVDFNGADLVD